MGLESGLQTTVPLALALALAPVLALTVTLAPAGKRSR